MASSPQITNQTILLHQINFLFPREQIHVDSRKHLKYPTTGTPMELDIWIPKYNLAFEFQDSYHYITTWYSQLSREEVITNDAMKNNETRIAKISLINIPCWWDGSIESLKSTIEFHRPDLNTLFSPLSSFSQIFPPISLFPPAGFLPNVSIPGVGELMLASFPSTDLSDIHPDKWWLGEKYDGIRFCWNPKRNLLYSRIGRQLSLLPSLQACIPPIFVDGEFWFGRGMFGLTVTLQHGIFDNIAWDKLRMMLFDVPSKVFHNKPFEQRYSRLLKYILVEHPFGIIVPRTMCKGYEHMAGASKRIMQHDGEGIVLRMAGSNYVHGRNIYLIKFKSAHHDKEGLVVGINHDCITLKLPSGVTFEVEMEDVHTPSAPQLGDVVTFTYGISSRRELPENPKIVRTRTDIKWDDLLSQSGSSQLKKDLRMERYSAKPQNFWSFDNMRTFMKKIIEGHNLDPLLPQSWFSIPKNSISQSKGVRTIVQKFGGYFKTLNALFPDIGMLDYKSSYLRIWREPTYRRQFFESYAKEQGFDPLFANNWHQHSFTDFKSKKAESLLKYHSHSIKQALIDLFPEIGLEQSKFVYRVNRVFHLDNTFAKWKNPENRRYFFENYAKEHGFDPLNPDNWTAERRRDVAKAKGGHGVLHYYIDNVRKALVDLFPDVNWENSKVTLSHKYWKEPNARRKFFENYAEENKFNPTVPDNWYPHAKKLTSMKGIFSIIQFHGRNVPRALMDLFPEVNFDEDKFFINESWHTPFHRRRFFEKFAADNHFDPLNAANWYSQAHRRIMQTKGAPSVVRYHNSSVSTALMELFPNIGLHKTRFQHWRTQPYA